MRQKMISYYYIHKRTSLPDLTLFHGSILTLSTNACTVHVLAHKTIERHNLHFFLSQICYNYFNMIVRIDD
jgi:hypothetical protein